MYTLMIERRQPLAFILQLFLLGLSFPITEKCVEYLVDERQLLPESFLIESALFLGIWLCLDAVSSIVLKMKSCFNYLLNNPLKRNSFVTLLLAWGFASLFFQFHSFILECCAMLVLWFALDFCSRSLPVTRK